MTGMLQNSIFSECTSRKRVLIWPYQVVNIFGGTFLDNGMGNYVQKYFCTLSVMICE